MTKDVSGIDLQLIFKKDEEIDLLWQWRNEELTRQASFHTEKLSRADFIKKFHTEYCDHPQFPPLFIVSGQQRVGVVHFKRFYDQKQRFVSPLCISIHLTEGSAYQGIGTEALEKAALYLKERRVEAVFAEIREDNLASIRAFEKAGFVLDETLEKKQIKTHLYCLELQKQHLSANPSNGVFVIAEAGSNFRLGSYPRDLAMAKTLIDVAVDAGADAVKFQTYRPETVYAKGAGRAQYLQDNGIEEDIHEIFRDLAMPYEMIAILAEYAEKQGIEWMSSPFSQEDFNQVNPYVKRHKIASYEISHMRLLELAAQSKKPLILSTGAANQEDIQWAIDTFYQAGGTDLTLLQCTAKYPAPQETMNLSVIPFLKERYQVKVGLSDHSRDPVHAPLIAASLGACVVEKHYTLHRGLPGPDHSFAVEPLELKQMVQAIRAYEKMIGSPKKKVLQEETELYQFASRAVQTTCRVAKGDLLQEGVNIAILRPGEQKKGVHPRYLEEIEGEKALFSIEAGCGVAFEDYKESMCLKK